jgi:metal-responsive CopG/Arc/MetJ family transcriptional regulator
MRTTIHIDDQILAEIKQLAAQSGQTMTAIIEEALRQMLARRQQIVQRPPVSLITVSGNGTQPGVTLGDTATLFWVDEHAFLV